MSMFKRTKVMRIFYIHLKENLDKTRALISCNGVLYQSTETQPTLTVRFDFWFDKDKVKKQPQQQQLFLCN